MPLLSIHDDNVKSFITSSQLIAFQPELERCHRVLEEGTGAGSDFLGWVRLPSKTSQGILNQIEELAQEIRESADIFVCIGIGGSYLGAQSAIEFLQDDDFVECDTITVECARLQSFFFGIKIPGNNAEI